MIMLLNNIFLLCFRYFLRVSKYGIKKVTTRCRSWATLSVFRVGFFNLSSFVQTSTAVYYPIRWYRYRTCLLFCRLFITPPPLPSETVMQAGREFFRHCSPSASTILIPASSYCCTSFVEKTRNICRYVPTLCFR
jgi:hypothetical protein